jgi:hypothetical protein
MPTHPLAGQVGILSSHSFIALLPFQRSPEVRFHQSYWN